MSCAFPRCSGILLRGIKAVCMISSWHPTPDSLFWILPAGLGLPALVICSKADPGRTFLQLPHCIVTQSHTQTGFSHLVLLLYLSLHILCLTAGLAGWRQTCDGTCKQQRVLSPSVKTHPLAMCYGLGWKAATAPSPWLEQGALPHPFVKPKLF